MEYYNELPKQLPVVYTGDVIVAGGGTAGITAAVAAKRSGAERVLLIEKGGFLGGMLTAGGVMNLRQFSDGAGGCAVAGINAFRLVCSKSKPNNHPLCGCA